MKLKYSTIIRKNKIKYHELERVLLFKCCIQKPHKNVPTLPVKTHSHKQY